MFCIIISLPFTKNAVNYHRPSIKKEMKLTSNIELNVYLEPEFVAIQQVFSLSQYYWKCARVQFLWSIFSMTCRVCIFPITLTSSSSRYDDTCIEESIIHLSTPEVNQKKKVACQKKYILRLSFSALRLNHQQ